MVSGIRIDRQQRFTIFRTFKAALAQANRLGSEDPDFWYRPDLVPDGSGRATIGVYDNETHELVGRL